MRLLLDTCVWGGAREQLRAQGHDVIWAGEWPEDPGDEEDLRGGAIITAESNRLRVHLSTDQEE